MYFRRLYSRIGTLNGHNGDRHFDKKPALFCFLTVATTMSDNRPPLAPGGTHADDNLPPHHYDDELLPPDEDVEPTGNEEWDEGGPSHCGYSESVHDTLMSVGKSVHGVVGEPSHSVEQGFMKKIGVWFQEMSYAVRDLVRGEKTVEDISYTAQGMKDDVVGAVYGDEKL